MTAPVQGDPDERLTYVVEFEYRDTPGPRLVGPFASREDALDWAFRYVEDGEAVYHAMPLTSPTATEASR